MIWWLQLLVNKLYHLSTIFLILSFNYHTLYLWNKINQQVISFFYYTNSGKNCCLNSSTVDLFLMNEPQSTSTKNMVHLAQSKSFPFSYLLFFVNRKKTCYLAILLDGPLWKVNHGGSIHENHYKFQLWLISPFKKKNS